MCGCSPPCRCFEAVIEDNTNTIVMHFGGELVMDEDTIRLIARDLEFHHTPTYRRGHRHWSQPPQPSVLVHPTLPVFIPQAGASPRPGTPCESPTNSSDSIDQPLWDQTQLSWYLFSQDKVS
ncbi:hypothetical protein BJX99DRAFT_242691 [Aspergillus californicus]